MPSDGCKSVLFASHSWWGISAGGAERAAVALSKEISRLSDWETHLLAAVPFGSLKSKGTPFAIDDEGTILLESETNGDLIDWSRPDQAIRSWTELLGFVQPAIVHLHHYFNLGIRTPRLIKKWNPDTRVVMTLHEYGAICGRDGLFLKGRQRCESAGIRKCASCLGKTQSEVFIRDQFLREHLSFVDAFICPSEFLAQKYVDWGLDPRKIHQIPNALGLENGPSPSRAAMPHGDVPRFIYLGQHTPVKGLDCLLDACEVLIDQGFIFHLDIYGDGSHRWPEFETYLKSRSAQLKSRVAMRGKYEPHEIEGILQGASATVVPSIWFENSPYVIEEALLFGVPVIVADVGALKEKVVDGEDGWHFRVDDPIDLARVMELAHQSLQVNGLKLRVPERDSDVAWKHSQVYDQLLGRVAHG